MIHLDLPNQNTGLNLQPEANPWSQTSDPETLNPCSQPTNQSLHMHAPLIRTQKSSRPGSFTLTSQTKTLDYFETLLPNPFKKPKHESLTQITDQTPPNFQIHTSWTLFPSESQPTTQSLQLHNPPLAIRTQNLNFKSKSLARSGSWFILTSQTKTLD